MTSTNVSKSFGFRNGPGLAIVNWPTVALLQSSDRELVEGLWGGLSAGGDGGGLIEDSSINGLRTLGSFVVVQFEGEDARIFVRGAARVRCVGQEGSVELDGESVRTWVEQLVRSCRSLDMGLDGALGFDEPFRLADGIVPADRLSWTSSEPHETDSSHEPNKSDSLDEPHETDWLPEPAESDQQPDAPATELDLPRDVGESSPSSAPGDSGQTLHFEALEVRSETHAELEHAVDAEPSAEAESASEPDNGAPVEESLEEYDYDALFGKTTHRSVQDAAVAEPVEEEAVEHLQSGAVADPVARPDPAPVPGQRLSPDLPLSPSAPETPAPVLPSLISGVPSSSDDSAPAAAAPADQGDHDGLTMTVGQLRALRESDGSGAGAPHDAAPGGAMVQAVVCGSGHPNPTVLDVCRTCGLPLGSEQTLMPRPPLGRIQLSTGQVIELTRSAIVGRNPRVEGTMHGEVPATIKIEGIQALSRSHAIIRLEGWQVLVEDLDSANGTTVTLQGRPPRRLRAGEPILVDHGTTIDLGGEVTGTYDAFA